MSFRDTPNDFEGEGPGDPALRRLAPILWSALVLLTGCAPATRETPAPIVVTADIQAGIERHIEVETQRAGGYFRVLHDGHDLKLRLVRVHTEYLANLGPRRHFACVDLVDTSGDVYDVDFFLSGDPGNMTVTETTVHKLNGQPYYAWEQKADRTWHRVAVDTASPMTLGVLRGRDEFEFLYRARLPELTGPARMWLPLAASDTFQAVTRVAMNVPGKSRVLTDRDFGNEVLFVELSPEDGGRELEIRYRVVRLEKGPYVDPDADPLRALKPESRVPDDERFRTIAAEVLADRHGDLVRARALYDHVIDQMRYMKYGSGWGQGDALYACDVRTGNCTDFHAYFIALARAAGIPARFAIGAAVPAERNDGNIDGYHCWAEFHAEGRWWPVDISEGDKTSSLATYYFGHHPANRIELSRGRDLVVDPAPTSGPINYLAYPLLEVGGEPVRAEVTFSFRRPHLPNS